MSVLEPVRRHIRLPFVLLAGAGALLATALVGPGGAQAEPKAPPKAVECLAGSVMARAFVDTSASFSADYTTTGVSRRYNCESPADIVQVKRINTGWYEVKFPGISNQGAGPLIASVDVAQLIGGITTSADLNIASATYEAGGLRTLRVVCKDVDSESNTDFCDFTVTLFSK